MPLTRSLHWGPDPGVAGLGRGPGERGVEHVGDGHWCCTGKARVLLPQNLCVRGGPGGAGRDMGTWSRQYL